jgi:cyclohexanone monooxygenase
VCVGTAYFETFNRDNVTLVDVQASPIEAITPTGLRTTERHYEFDILIFATGFDAMIGALARIDVRGRGGRTLRDAWADGPRSYLGLVVSGFPNLFTVNGPGSPGILNNVAVAIEQHVEWIAELLIYARAKGFNRIEADSEAQQQWSDHVAQAAAETLFTNGKSWWFSQPAPGKPRVFMPYVRGLGAYVDICTEIVASDYRGFRLS